MRRLLAVVSELPSESRVAIEAAGGSTTLAERALGGVVATLQTFAKQLHAQAAKPAVHGNPWHNIKRLQRQWLADFGADPLAGLGDVAVNTLRIGFARRHVLEHNGGVVDERYQQESGEGVLGRRLRIRAPFVEQVFDAAIALADQLEATGKPQTPG